MLELGVVVMLYLALSAWQERHLLDESASAPDFELPSLDGRSIRLSDLAGKRTLIHFWATWCGVCRREIFALNALYDKLGPDELLLSVVADSSDADHVADVVAQEGIEYPVLLATSEVLRRYRVDAFPTNYFIDERGTIRYRTVGMSTRWTLAARLGCAKAE